MTLPISTSEPSISQCSPNIHSSPRRIINNNNTDTEKHNCIISEPSSPISLTSSPRTVLRCKNCLYSYRVEIKGIDGFCSKGKIIEYILLIIILFLFF